MDDDRGAARIPPAPAVSVAGADAISAPSALPPVVPSRTAVTPSSGAGKEARRNAPPPPPLGGERRMRFSVELKPGETTIVSWKKLLKESGKESGGRPSVPAAADPPFAAQAGPADLTKGMPGNEPKDAAQPPSRFSAVIEKIERLYMGKHSSDEEEELDDIPDDDQYDTEDSFIDDTELDEYFQVDKLATKHDGYFVNKGKLEQIETSSLSPKEAPKKRRRKDSTKHQGGILNIDPSDGTNLGDMPIKDAARGVPLEASSLSSTHDFHALQGEHHNQGKLFKHKESASPAIYKKKPSEPTIISEDLVIPGATSNIVLSLPSERKNFDKNKAPKPVAHKVQGAIDPSDPFHLPSHHKDQVEFQHKKLINGEMNVANKTGRKEKLGTVVSAALDSPVAYPTQSLQSSSKMNEGSSVRPKGTTLERAIRDLEMIVSECRPSTADVQDADPALQGVKRRLPQEVKQKLAKVARLSAIQGKISEDMINRLMGILGHLLQRKTLKRHLKVMVESGLFAKQQKTDKFQHMKGEVYDMIRAHVSHLKIKAIEQQDGSADDFQERIPSDERRALKGKASMDAAMEDKICDLYDLYVEGMDEDKGPLCRKLYVELAELWPNGYMDSTGIRDAINRSKDRKRALYGHKKVHDLEKIKRKNLTSGSKVDGGTQGSGVRPADDRSAADTTSQALVSTKLVPTQVAASVGRLSDPALLSADFVNHGMKKVEKSKGTGVSNASDTVIRPYPDMKKKMKRKSESELSKTHPHPQKIPHEITEKHKSLGHSGDAKIVTQQPRPTSELPGLVVSDHMN